MMKDKRSHDESVIGRKQRGMNRPMQSDSRDAMDATADAATDADVQVLSAKITACASYNNADSNNLIAFSVTDLFNSCFCNSVTYVSVL